MSPSEDPPSSTSSPAPKIAIKGFSLSSKSSTSISKPKAKAPSTLGKRPRAHAHFGHDDDASDSDSASERAQKHEVVTGFGIEGAIGKEEARKGAEPLIIPRIKNRDWKGEALAKRGKNLLPEEVQAARREAAGGGGGEKQEGVDVVNSKDGEIQWGLSVRKREAVEEVVDGQDQDQDQDQDQGQGENSAAEAVKLETVEENPQSADEEALAALLGEKKEKKGPDLVIEALSPDAPDPRVSEEDAYRRAVALAPDVSTLEDYDRIPVEEFGAAMLRGMGWKGEANASDKARNKVKEVKRRQNLLGLGAKELKDAEELGAWVQKSDVKRLNGGGGDRRKERRPGVQEYKRERDERRYREGGYRESERDRERDKERERGNGYRERDRHSHRDHRDRRR